MSHIILEHASLTFPIYGTETRSLKHNLIKATIGGKLRHGNTKFIEVKALHDINLSILTGDRVGLIGHNGAGKSTLLKVMAGIYAPSSGTVNIEGSTSSLLDLNVGMQQHLSGYENIRIRGLILGMNQHQIQKLREDVENFTELGDYLSMPIRIYSSGMQMRLAFALSTASQPDILLVDEVIGAGDSSFMEKAKKRIESFIHHANILVLASHDCNVLRQFCNKVIWLEHGQIKIQGLTEEVIEYYMNPQEVSIPV